jgi:2-polyprenyl-3-methyl-5-hydroxy-6-metoxy-1,4-benzoquinol methylase
MPAAMYYARARAEVLQHLPKTFTKIVDVGGSSGGTLTAVKTKTPNAKTVLLDYDAPSVERAREAGHEAFQCDLNDGVPDVVSDADVVMFLDILEHLVDPWRVLREAVAKMKSGATVIVSLPNVRFAGVSLKLLLNGEWTLQDEGVLDRTHLRFFTRETGAELVRSAMLELKSGVALVHNSRKYRYLNFITLGGLRDLLSAQNLYVAVKP